MKNKFVERNILYIVFLFFYIIIFSLLFAAMIISVMTDTLFADIDTAFYWINEIMFTVRQVLFIGVFICILISYIEKRR